MDLAGTVEAVAPGVTTFKAGDDVYGMAGGIGGLQGTLAEFAALDADLLALKPTKLSMREAAAMPLVFITAWQGLVDRANVHAGQKVLVHAGAGGIGHVAMQIAQAFGDRVFATVSKDEAAIPERLGATAIDYKGETVEAYASFQAVRTYTGHVVSCLGWGVHKLASLSFRGATYSGVDRQWAPSPGRHLA
jgi:NADPH:quinone reductase